MLNKNLQEIGLNEKESKVYLSSLELGATSVQNIAKKAEINRPTTYFVIEGLMKKCLMSSFQKGKKQFFSAGDPDALLDILNQEKIKLEKQKTVLKNLIPELRAVYNNKDKPIVRFYDGKGGIVAMMEELLKRTEGKEILMCYSVDGDDLVFTSEEKKYLRAQRTKKGIKTRTFYNYKKGVLKSDSMGERIKLPEDKFPLKSEVVIYDKFVRFVSPEKRVGVVIEDKEIAKSMKIIFELAWMSAKNYKVEK